MSYRKNKYKDEKDEENYEAQTSQLGRGRRLGTESGLVKERLLLGLVTGQFLVLQVLQVLFFLKKTRSVIHQVPSSN